MVYYFHTSFVYGAISLLTRKFYIFSRLDGLLERAKSLKVNAGCEPGTDLGPVISRRII